MPETADIKPITARNVGKQLDRNDFFVSVSALQTYLTNLDFDVEMLESDKIEQLTPLGIAVVADCYNNKGDQYCNILIACTSEELKNIINKLSLTSSAKVVVIFQPTDGSGEKFFPSFHKTVVYIEKTLDRLYVIHADCVHAEAIEGYVERLTHEALPNGGFTFYKQEPMLHSDGSWLHLQAGYTQCGTHAIRIARKMAKKEIVLNDLHIVTEDNSTLDGVKIATYMLPPFLAINADSSVTRSKLLTMYTQGKAYENLNAHFSKYTKYEYAGKFSHKYIGMVDEILQTSSDTDLNERIDRADANKFKLKI